MSIAGPYPFHRVVNLDGNGFWSKLKTGDGDIGRDRSSTGQMAAKGDGAKRNSPIKIISCLRNLLQVLLKSLV